MKPPFPPFETGQDPEDVEKNERISSVTPPHIADDAELPKDESNTGQSGEDWNTTTRLRDVPFRMLVPSLITLMAICSGLTAIRLAFEARFELALVAVIFAAILDALDGRVARFLKSTTQFGEQMDSLADFVNFGVAPAMILYMWILRDMRTFGWIFVLIFAICGCLRLARFNVMLDNPNKPDWTVNFFTGVPAPAGALLVMLPVYLGILGLGRDTWLVFPSALYTLAIGLLMVSSLPTFSGKKIGQRVSPSLVVPVMIGAVLAVIFLFSYPWISLSLVSLGYLASLPLSYLRYQRYMEEDQR